MTPTIAAWPGPRDGAAHLRGLMTRMGDDAFAEPSRLPGWTRAHVLTHLARNADAHDQPADLGPHRRPHPGLRQPRAAQRRHRGRRRAHARGDPRRRRSRRRTGWPPSCGRCRRRPGRRASPNAQAPGSGVGRAVAAGPRDVDPRRRPRRRRLVRRPAGADAARAARRRRRDAGRAAGLPGAAARPTDERGPGRWGRCQDGPAGSDPRCGSRWWCAGRRGARGVAAGPVEGQPLRRRREAPADSCRHGSDLDDGDHPGIRASPTSPRCAPSSALPDGFPAAVLAEAAEAAAGGAAGTGRVDATDIELVTIDPPGAKDLDQALGIIRRGDGFRVHYAIADLGAVVVPGGALDAEVRKRGQTVYLPDGSVPLHPPVLSEDAASLLPDGPRPAVLWTIDLDARASARPSTCVGPRCAPGPGSTTRACRPTSTPGVPTPRSPRCPSWARCAGPWRCAAGRSSWSCPTRRSCRDGAGGWTTRVRQRPPVEDWNAEISLLTGTAARHSCWTPGVGVLRTLPAPEPVGRGAAAAHGPAALGIDWPDGATAAQLLSGPAARHTRRARAAPGGQRRCCGARATPRSTQPAGTAPPADPGHGGIGAPYAHVTAPLRRLVDRFGTEVCLAVTAGAAVPEWLTRRPAHPARGDGGVRRGGRPRWSGPAWTAPRPRCWPPGRRGVRRGRAAGLDRRTSPARSTSPSRPCWPGAPACRGRANGWLAECRPLRSNRFAHADVTGRKVSLVPVVGAVEVVPKLPGVQFRYGIEHELAILRGRTAAFADFTDLRFDELQAVVDALPEDPADYPDLRVGDQGIKRKRWYVEGYERFDDAGELVRCDPKGLEVRTRIHDSVEAAVAALGADVDRLAAELRPRAGSRRRAIGFNPLRSRVRDRPAAGGVGARAPHRLARGAHRAPAHGDLRARPQPVRRRPGRARRGPQAHPLQPVARAAVVLVAVPRRGAVGRALGAHPPAHGRPARRAGVPRPGRRADRRPTRRSPSPRGCPPRSAGWSSRRSTPDRRPRPLRRAAQPAHRAGPGRHPARTAHHPGRGGAPARRDGGPRRRRGARRDRRSCSPPPSARWPDRPADLARLRGLRARVGPPTSAPPRMLARLRGGRRRVAEVLAASATPAPR